MSAATCLPVLPGDIADARGILRASVRRVPLAGQSQTVCVPEGSSLAQLVDAAFPDAFLRRFVVAFVGGVEIAPDQWAEVRPSAGAFVNLCIRPGDGDSGVGKVLRTVLQIAVIAAAMWVGNAIGGLPGMIASALVTMGGNLLINSLIPVAPLRAQGEQPAPFYTVTGARNQARVYAPASFVLGRHRFFPPLYGRYVQETVGNDVYLRVPFCLGPAPVQVSDLRIGDTPLSSFAGVEIEQRLTADAVDHTLYTGDPDQEPVGAQLTTTYTARNTATDVDEIEVVLGFRGGLGGYDSKQRKVSKSVGFEIRYRPAGTSDAWQTHRPNVPQANAGSAAAGVPFRPHYFLSLPNLTGYIAELNALGAVPSGPVTVSRADPGRGFQHVVRFAVPRHPAGYAVEVRRTTAESTNPNTIDAVWWEILGSQKSFADPFPEKGLASIVLRIKASAQLSGVIDSFNAIVEPIVPLFSSAAKASPDTASAASLTTTGVSRNHAEIVLNLYRGPQAARPRPDDRIDWPAWAAFAAWCEAQGLHYDEVIDTTIGRGELARRICASAFARPIRWGGKLSVVIDRDRTGEAPAQVFTPRNVANLQWRKSFPLETHAVRIAFNNADNGYQADEVTLYLDGYDAANATKFETLAVAGKTDPDEVRRVGRQFINNSLRQTESFTFDMDAEALTCRPGAYAVLLHDAIGVGLGAARVKTLETSGANVTAFVLDVGVATEASDTLAARWRKADGAGGFEVASEAGVTRDAANPARFVFGTPRPVATAPAVDEVVLIGRSTEVSLPVLVRDIAPDFGHRASVTVIPYAGERFTPDGDPLPPHNPMVQLPIAARPVAPVALTTTANAREIALAFRQDASPRGVQLVGFETAVRETGTADDSWQDRGPLPADARVLVAPPGNPGYSYDLRVVAVGNDSGGLPVRSDPLIVSGIAAATVPAAPAGCNASFTTRTSPAGAQQLVLSCDWDPVEDPDVIDTVVELLTSTGPDVWSALQSGLAVSGAMEIHGLQVGRDYQLGFRHLSRRGIASARTTVALITAADVLVAAAAASVPWTGVTTRPANLAALSGTEGINNALVAAGANGLVDTGFRFTSLYWSREAQSGSVSTTTPVSTGGLRKIALTGSGVTVGHYLRLTSGLQQTNFPCKPGDVIGGRMLAGGDNLGQLQLYIAFRDAAGVAVGFSTPALVSSGILDASGEETTFNELAVVATAPAGTVIASIDLRGIAASAAPVLRVAKPLFARLAVGQTAVPLYAPGREHEVGANVTETRVAAAVTGQGWGATASEAQASNAQVPAGANGLVDTAFRFQSTCWTKNQSSGSTAFTVETSTQGLRKSVVTGTGVTTGGTNNIQHSSFAQIAHFSCREGDKVAARVLVGSENVSQVEVLINFRGPTGTIVANSTTTFLASGLLAGTGEEGTFNELTAVGVAPAGAACASLQVIARTPTTSAPILRIARPLLARVSASQAVAPLYAPGREHEIGANVTETRVAAAVLSQGGLATANGYYQASAPSSPPDGSLWGDTASNQLKYRTAGAWVVIADITPAGGISNDLKTFTKAHVLTNVTTSSADQLLAIIDVTDVGAGGFLAMPGTYVLGSTGGNLSSGVGTFWYGELVLTEQPLAGGTEVDAVKVALTIENAGSGFLIVEATTPTLTAQTYSGSVRYRLRLRRTSGSNNIINNGVFGKAFVQRVPG